VVFKILFRHCSIVHTLLKALAERRGKFIFNTWFESKFELRFCVCYPEMIKWNNYMYVTERNTGQ